MFGYTFWDKHRPVLSRGERNEIYILPGFEAYCGWKIKSDSPEWEYYLSQLVREMNHVDHDVPSED